MGTYIVVQLEFMYVVATSGFKALYMLLELILSIYVFMLSIYLGF